MHRDLFCIVESIRGFNIETQIYPRYLLSKKYSRMTGSEAYFCFRVLLSPGDTEFIYRNAFSLGLTISRERENGRARRRMKEAAASAISLFPYYLMQINARKEMQHAGA